MQSKMMQKKAVSEFTKIGFVKIPEEILVQAGIKPRDDIEFFVDDDKVVLKKPETVYKDA